jgi:hypothetical protein
VVPHEPGVSVRRVVPEGGEGPFCYVVGLVGPHEVWRWKAPPFQCKSRTGSCHDAVRGAPCVLVFHVVASDEAVLKAVIVLDVLVVELLLILVELAGSFGLLCDGGEILLGAAAFGPIVRIALGVALGFLKPDVFLPASLGLRAVEAAGEAGPIIRITSELDGLPPALLGRRVVEVAGEAGPFVRIASGLGGLLPALLGRRAAEAAGDAGLIVRIALGRVVEVAGEAGPIVRITSGLDGLLVPTSLGRRAAEGAGDAGLIVRIASEVAEEPVGFVELDSLLPASLGLRAVEAAEDCLRASKLLLGRLVLRLLPRGPACCLRFRHAAIELGPASGIPASRDGLAVVRDLWPP